MSTQGEPLSDSMFLVDASPRPRRWRAFVGSVLVHCSVVALLAQVSYKPSGDEPLAVAKQYSVSFVQLEMPREYVKPVSQDVSRAKPAEPRKAPRLATPQGGPQQASAAPVGKSESAALTEPQAKPEPPAKREPRQFQLPPTTRSKPATQTLVQMDVPPDVVLPMEVPLPTILSWTDTKLRAPKRQFVAPARKMPVTSQSLPAAPVLEAPNQEIAVGTVNIASAVINNSPRLVRLPTIAAPVSSAGVEPAKEIPQIGLANSNQPSAGNLISQPNTPLRSSGVVAIPPANQVAPEDRSGGGAGGGGGAGNATGGASVSGAGAAGSGTAQAGLGNGRGISGQGSADGRAPGKGNGGSVSGTIAGLGGPSAGAGGAPNGTGTADHAGGTDNVDIPGVTRLMLPVDGRFAAVVLGSPDATRYPESAGVLRGKVVYTVYLRVGTHKNWILQYGLPRSAAGNPAGNGGAPIDAPWPFLIMRPDQLSAQANYVMVHGMITTTGEFDQLSMVFPGDFEKKDLLLNSLKLWKFRPARRDGDPAAVEILLTIPRQID